MSYQVLARKWRPRNFGEVVGQQHVLRPLFNALQTGRLHHAWLLTGTRGVGKTTIARILAKSLNCEQGVTAEPCGECAACVAIDQGRFVDLLEIDAASRTKVEDTRELLDNVQYAPTQGRYKVYLIDEVHMLSRHSFNALLKTLEEPPEHVKFLLATTDPQKLPITVLSRCLQFNLKALSRDEISGHLQQVLTAENITFEEPAVQALAKAAQGSLRDALSLTDQAIAQGDHSVTMVGVQQMLGSVPSFQLVNLLQQVLAGDAEAMLQTLDTVASQVPDLSGLVPELQNLIHQLALFQAVPSTAQATGLEASAQHLAQQLPAELLHVFYDILVQGRRDLNYASDVRSGVEMTLLRLMAFRPEYLEVVETSAETVTQTKTVAAAPPPSKLTQTTSEQVQAQQQASVKQDQTSAQPNVSAEQADAAQSAQYDGEPTIAQEPDIQPEPEAHFEPEPEQEPEQQAVPAPANDLQALLATRQALAQKKNPEVAAPAEQEPSAPNNEPSAPNNEPSAPNHEPSAPQPASENGLQAPVTQAQAEISATTKRAAEVDQWAAMIDELDLHGLTRQLARNSVFTQHGDKNVLMVRRNWAYLLNDGAVVTIKEAMVEQFDIQLHDVLVGDAEAATPVEIQQQINALRLEAAKQTLAEDPLAQQLASEFGATLTADSVKPD
ncbi:DNA polymerase III subunit gamma/tau [Pseudidiomarina woesei]|uniref:DNA polymerase III subunit gamma/tau n=1 Tax=Pseudidiomarina woesei TaxID=1381080 RepID=A0A0K6GX10_9GAMM|nr:DNA polymerase III subunit gamma/tau [Pseudidiomarina woesei]CUA83282.1 DNA polymerase III, gamma subunit [Pseudidiomarina woesei]